MKALGSFLAALLAILSIIFVAVLIVAMLSAPSTTTVPVAAALLAATGVLGSKAYERKTYVLQERMKVQAAIYEQLLLEFFKAADCTDEAGRQAGLRLFFHEFTAKALVYGSDGFIQSWNQFRHRASGMHMTNEEQGVQALASLGDLILAMRQDLGHSNSVLKPADVAMAILNPERE